MASPEKSRPITVTVTAIYGGQKAEQWRTVNIGTVQRDLDYLDFVQPKRQNFSFGERGVVQFWWDTTFHSVCVYASSLSDVIQQQRILDSTQNTVIEGTR